MCVLMRYGCMCVVYIHILTYIHMHTHMHTHMIHTYIV